MVLTTGCDKTTPAGIMAATTVNIPAIVLSGGPMLDGWHEERAGRLGYGDLAARAASWRPARSPRKNSSSGPPSSAPSAGHCNTMGTASTMNAVAEALGLPLTGCAAIPAPYRERGQMAPQDRPAHRRPGL
ncbi:dihydroxy-acid dehydratase [Caulobacter segnis]